MNDKKPILCHTCRNVDCVLLAGSGAKMIEECFFPDNQHKFGRATKCEEYDQKTDEQP